MPSVRTRKQQSRVQTRRLVSLESSAPHYAKQLLALPLERVENLTFVQVETHDESCCYVLGGSGPETCSSSLRWGVECQAPQYHRDFLRRSRRG